MFDLSNLTPWDLMLKKMLWQQLGPLEGQKILDFGSGEGWTAAKYAQHNDVTAVEPSGTMLEKRVGGDSYLQLQGSCELLSEMPDETFDVIFCHNVLKYIEDKEAVLKALARLLKPGGRLSLVKHNRLGRIMQMTVLLNDFEHAHALLSGENGRSGQFGAIRYYDDADVLRWLPEMRCTKLWGLRTFWDMQQNQQCHADAEWQEKMLAIETRVSTMPTFQAISFFHHMLLYKMN